MAERFPRDLLERWFPGDPRMQAAFEEQEEAIDANTTGVAETAALKDATVLVLSSNGEFNNEYVIAVGTGLSYDVEDGLFTIRANVTEIIGVGELVTRDEAETLTNKTLAAPLVSGLGNYANDAAAAAGGVPINGLYHNAGAVRIRLV